MNLENPAELQDMNVENSAELQDMNVENLAIFSNEQALEECAKSLYQSNSFTMDSMETLTSLMNPIQFQANRSFSKAKGKDSALLHLGMFSHGKFCGVLNKTWRFPWVTRYANAWLKAQPNMSEATWTSLAFSVNTEARPHRDLHNLEGSANYLVTFGNHSGGEVWLRDPGEAASGELWRRKGPNGQSMLGSVKSTWHEIVSFDPKSWHATMRWSGRRVALAAYTTRLVVRAQPDILQDLREFGFVAPKGSQAMSGLFQIKSEVENDEVILQETEKDEIMAVVTEYQEILTENPEETKGSATQILELGSPGTSCLRDRLESGGAEVTTVSFRDGCDLTTQVGTARTSEIVRSTGPQWVVCYIPQGSNLQPEDPRWDKARLRQRKVLRNFLKVSCDALSAGCKVVWIHSGQQRCDGLPEVREFWRSHQDYHGGQAVSCGPCWIRSSDTSVLHGIPNTSRTTTSPWRPLAEKMLEAPLYAAEVLVTEAEKELLATMDKKELTELIERAHKIHCRLGHPSNRLLIRNLKVRGADPKLIAAASQLTCDQCQEGKRKARRPMVQMEKSERLWETLQLDLCHHRIGSQIHHFLLMQDEASGYAVIRRIKVTSEHEGWNASSVEVKNLVQEAWLQYFGAPSIIKLDAEGALRGHTMADLADEHGIELQVCPAEHHEFLSEVERAIGILKEKIESFLRGNPIDPGQAALAMVQAHNTHARIHGFSPLQWALGRDFSPGGSLNQHQGELAAISAAATPGTEASRSRDVRLQAAKAFLEHRERQWASRASNTRPHSSSVYLPGDLVFYQRLRHPADMVSNRLVDRPRMRTSRWFGPARVLASETKGQPGDRKPSAHVWIIASGRLKKAHVSQLRHASETEKLIAESSGTVVYPWTLTSLTATMGRGSYEDLTVPPLPHHRQRPVGDDQDGGGGLLPGDGDPELLPDPPQDQRDADMDSEEEMIEDRRKEGMKRPAPVPEANEEEMIRDDETLDLERLLNDPDYVPLGPIPPAPPHTSRPSSSFQQQRAEHERQDRPPHVLQREASEQAFWASPEQERVFGVTIPAPENAAEWRRMVKDPSKFVAKTMAKGVEVTWGRLSDRQRAAMQEAKSIEVQQWLRTKVARKVSEHVEPSSLIGMRWVLTFKAAEPDAEGKEQVKAKARIVVLGYSAPNLLEEPTTSPTMSRLTRQLMLNMASAMKWPIGSGDVKTAFLQARPEERSQRLLAKPLPELAEALGLQPHEAVELTGSAYGLAQAPREWFLDIQKTLKKLGGRPSRTDPCLWRIIDANGKVCGLIGSYVDDFLFTGDPSSPTWIRFLKSFEEAYTWSPWEWQSFDFCGLRLTQHGDSSITVDHSAFCRDLTQMPDVKGPSRTMTDGELSQARAVLGSVQWRVTQSGPQHAAKLGHLQSLLSTKDTACISQINKLVREVQSARHLGTHVQNLGDCPAEELIFVGWSDASLANRPDLSSTGGFLIGLMTPADVLSGQGKVNLVSWRSQKLPRVARSSLAAESQALSLAEQEMMWCRLTWREMLGDDINLSNPAEFTAKTKAYLIIDARGVYDALLKGADFSSGFNLRDKYSALDLMGVADQLKAQGTLLEWCDSDHQLADGLTKSSKQDSLRKFLTQGSWRLRLPGAFMSARRRRALESEQAAVPVSHRLPLRSEEKSAAPRWGYLREWCFVRVLTSDSCCQRLIDVSYWKNCGLILRRKQAGDLEVPRESEAGPQVALEIEALRAQAKELRIQIKEMERLAAAGRAQEVDLIAKNQTMAHSISMAEAAAKASREKATSLWAELQEAKSSEDLPQVSGSLRPEEVEEGLGVEEVEHWRRKVEEKKTEVERVTADQQRLRGMLRESAPSLDVGEALAT
ncbi:RE1, partial [Symbiodinium sp. CCMP2592]